MAKEKIDEKVETKKTELQTAREILKAAQKKYHELVTKKTSLDATTEQRAALTDQRQAALASKKAAAEDVEAIMFNRKPKAGDK